MHFAHAFTRRLFATNNTIQRPITLGPHINIRVSYAFADVFIVFLQVVLLPEKWTLLWTVSGSY